MKKLFTLLLALVTNVGLILAESGTCGKNLTWDLTNGVLTIKGTGAMTNWTDRYDVPWASNEISSVTIENGVTSIGDWAFYGQSKLATITIPESVTYIGMVAFNECSDLANVTIPNSVKSIGANAFTFCTSLTNPLYNTHVFAYMPYTYSGAYVIPDGIESIAGGAFYRCSNLTNVTIPASVTSIGAGAFIDCSGLASVYINDLAAWCAIDFEDADSPYGCYANPMMSSGYNQYKDLYLNGELVTNLVIPNNVTSISNYLFCCCKSITAVTIPNGVLSIGVGAFNDCPNLKELTISESVTNIGPGAFYYCGALVSITCKALTPPECDNSSASVFYMDLIRNNCTLYVQKESIDLYKKADVWKEFLNIQAITETAIDEVNANNQSSKTNKIIKDNQILIIRGDNTYTLTGQQMK